MESGLAPQRSILYYPTISVPSGAWLRRALFYWDKVASIVPEEEYADYTPDVEFLLSEGEFRPIYPVRFFEYPYDQIAFDFLEEVKQTVLSARFQRLLDSRRRQGFRGRVHGNVHENKIAGELAYFFEQQGLAEHDPDSPWVRVEETTALLYMSLLAKYLADFDLDTTVPGTNRKEYLDLSYAPISRDDDFGGYDFAALDIRFASVLPVPREDVPLDYILEFKRERKAELIRFRQLMDEFQKRLSEAEDQHEANLVLTQFKERIEGGLEDLNNQLRDARIATVAGSLATLVTSQATALAELLVGSGPLSIPLSVGGATIEVGSYVIDRRNERRAELRNSPLAYLYYAARELRT